MALRIGIALVTGDVCFDPGWRPRIRPRDYARLLAPILAGQADVVYGSRFLGKPRGMAWKNRMANWILAVSANLLYRARITDEATAYKAFRTTVLRGLRLNCRRFEFCPEVTAKLRRLGYRINEVPITYNARGIAGGKKIRARDGFEALWTLFRYRFTPRREIAGPAGFRPGLPAANCDFRIAAFLPSLLCAKIGLDFLPGQRLSLCLSRQESEYDRQTASDGLFGQSWDCIYPDHASTVYTAKELASAEHVPPHSVAKTVVFLTESGYGLAVVPPIVP